MWKSNRVTEAVILTYLSPACVCGPRSVGRWGLCLTNDLPPLTWGRMAGLLGGVEGSGSQGAGRGTVVQGCGCRFPWFISRVWLHSNSFSCFCEMGPHVR